MASHFAAAKNKSGLSGNQVGPFAAGAAESGEKPGAVASEDPAADSKKAATMLKMAKAFATTRADKAKGYAAKVIELAPTSVEAAGARLLIDRLK